MPGAKPGHVRTFQNKLAASGIKRTDYWDDAKGGRRHEVTFAVNVNTLEVRWYDGPREGADAWKEPYQPQPDWIAGTIDWVVEKDGVLVLISDLKTGNPGWDGKFAIPAEGNRQLYTYALPFWIVAGRPLKWKIKLRIEQWPKYPLDGLPELRYSSVTGLEMMLHLDDLRWALENTDHAAPDYETCFFCQGHSNCAAFLLSGISYDKK